MIVGFIGLGVMGAPMASNLVRAGYDVAGFNRTPRGVCGVRSVSLREAAGADVVITMLPDSNAVLSVADDIVAAGPGLWIDMSTIHPTVAIELAERGVPVLDAPVSGGDVGAREGTLSIMAGGAVEDFERALPVLEAMGRTIVHVGGPGAGQTVKACNQIVVALTIEAVSEALVLGSKAGVDPEKILDVLGGGLAANRVMELRRRNFLEHDFTPGFRVDLHHKDLNIALESGDAFGVALPATSLAQQMLRTLRARGRGAEDHSALLTVIEEWAGHRVGEEEIAWVA
jgi:2-hydroxy-3-oxopropionate reductase